MSFKDFLQSATKTSIPLGWSISFFIRSTTNFESSSISTAGSLRAIHKHMPSWRAQSFTATLVVDPITHANPLTHSPLSFWIKPHPLARSGFPNKDPFVFNLNQLRRGWCQRIWIFVLTLICFPLIPRCRNSVALAMTSALEYFWRWDLPKTMLLWWSQIVHRAKGKRIPHSIPKKLLDLEL